MVNALTTTVTGVNVAVLLNSVTINDVANGRSTATFYVNDDVAYTLKQQSPVTLSTTNEGVLFTGFVDSVETLRTSLITLNKRHLVTCKDGVWLASKRLFIGNEYVGRTAGDIVCDLHLNYLAAEGIIANYAARYDHDATSFGQGILTSTSASSGALELASAGTTYTKAETSQTDFNTGTLSGVQSNGNGTLTLAANNTLRMTGQAAANVSSNTYFYYKFWVGSHVWATGDYVQYDVWVSSTSPIICGGIDLVNTDGTNFRDGVPGVSLSNALDQNQLPSHPQTSLNTLANDQWYTRKIIVPSQLVGKTTSYACIALEGDNDGTYTFYVRHAKIFNSSNVQQNALYDGAASAAVNQPIGNTGYFNVSLKVVPTYETTGKRTNVNTSISSVGCVKSSIISWNATSTTQTGNASNYLPQVDIQTSTDDGATFQSCTNHGAIPNLPIGTSMAKNLQVRQVLAVGGANPEISPALNDCTVTVTPSYAVTKTDAYARVATSAEFATGTLSNVRYDTTPAGGASGLKLTGNYRNWDDNDITSQTLYGSSVNTPTMATTTRAFSNRVQGASEVLTRFDFAGNGWADFTTEVDVNIVESGNQYGIVYRTTFWGTAVPSTQIANCFAYHAYISSTAIGLGHGSNSSAGTWTQITSAAVTLVVGKWYRLKVVAAGTSHKVYVDDVLYINVTDSFTTAAGYQGVRAFNNDASSIRSSCFWDNYGVMTASFSGVRTAPTVSISACGVAQDSIIQWNQSGNDNTNILVETSTNGGTTWFTATNGAQIPNIVKGFNCAGLSLLVRATLTTQNASDTPVLQGLSWMVIGNYSASGTRISPLLDISTPVTCGSSSITWTSTIPTNTNIAVDISLDGKVTWLGATNGSAIPTINGAPTATIDDFLVNDSGNYTSTFMTGGAVTTVLFDTANEQLSLSGGTNAVYINNLASGKDTILDAISSQSNNGGIVFRYVDANNFYYIRVYDSSGVTPNTISLNKVVGGTVTTNIITATISFTRGTWHMIHISNIGTNITVLFDGVQKINTTDASLTTGKTGFYNNTGTSLWNTIQIAPQGDPLAGKTIYSRSTLTSTDPTVTADLRTLAISVRSTSIDGGVVVPITSYQYQQYIDGCIDDLAKRSNTWWNVDRNKKLQFQNRPDIRAPFALNSTDVLFQSSPAPTLKQISPAYRNRQYVLGGTNLVTTPISIIGDGVTTSWSLSLPVDSITSMTLHGSPITYSFGVQGVDTGKNYYYTKGSTTIAQDPTATPLDLNVQIDIVYQGQQQVVAISDSVSQQTALAAIATGTSGIVEKVETVTGATQAAAQQVADARITQYAILSRDWQFATLHAGLLPGQLLTIFVTEYGLMDVEMLITSVTINITAALDTTGNADLSIVYNVTCTEGAYLGQWTDVFVRN